MADTVRPAKARVFDATDAHAMEGERILVERAQSGDRDALGALLSRYGPVLYRSVLLPRLGGAAAAEDALSIVYQRVVERLGAFRWLGTGLYPWLRMVALHVALDQLRARRREVLYQPEDLDAEIDASAAEHGHGAPSVEAQAREDQDAARARLEAALEKINARYKVAIVSRVLRERSREDAARELGVTVATFDVILHRAMAALRKELGPARDTGDA